MSKFALGQSVTRIEDAALLRGADEAGAVDALYPLTGVKHIDMPATREKLWRALRPAEGGVH